MSPHGERGHRGPTVAPTPAPKLTHLLAQSGTHAHGTRGTYGTNNVPTLVPRNNAARATTVTPAIIKTTTTPSPALLSFTTPASMQESGKGERLLHFQFYKVAFFPKDILVYFYFSLYVKL